MQAARFALDQTVYLVHAIDYDNRTGDLNPYGLATDATIVDGRLTVLAGDDVLDVYDPVTWGSDCCPGVAPPPADACSASS